MQSFFKNRFKNKSFEQFSDRFYSYKNIWRWPTVRKPQDLFTSVLSTKKKNLKFGFPSKTGRENLRTDQEVLEFKPGDIRTSTSRWIFPHREKNSRPLFFQSRQPGESFSHSGWVPALSFSLFTVMKTT